MNKKKVVSDLAYLITWRFSGVSKSDIETVLVREGWAIGAVREAIMVQEARQ